MSQLDGKSSEKPRVSLDPLVLCSRTHWGGGSGKWGLLPTVWMDERNQHHRHPLQHTHIQTPGERPGLPGFMWVLLSRAGFPNAVGLDQLRCQWKYGFAHCVFAVGVFGVGQRHVYFYQALQVLLPRLASGNLDQMGSREGPTACLREGSSSLHAFPTPRPYSSSVQTCQGWRLYFQNPGPV